MSVGPLELPRNLVHAASVSPDPGFGQWVAQLPDVVERLAGRWGLELGPPFQPGGHGSWTAPVTDARRADLVLKVGWTHEEAVHEADGLRLWAGRGAVLLQNVLVEDDTTAMLLERARPGVELGQSVPQAQQDEVVAALLRRVWVPPPAGHPFRPLAQMCDAWADGAARAGCPAGLDAGLFQAGLDMFRALPRQSTDDALLVTDLHAGNVLSAEREPWLLLDPKPYVGDRHYDPLQHLVNCQDRLVADPRGLTARMADLGDLDVSRLRQWLFARWVVESAQASPQDLPSLWQVVEALAP